MLYYWSLAQYQTSYEKKNSDKKIKKPKPLTENSMCVNIPMQTERQRELVKILQLSWEFFCDLKLAVKLLH